MMTTVAFAAALVLVVAGVALLTIPGALMAAGVILGGLTVLHERG